jgi:hypothetical protein
MGFARGSALTLFELNDNSPAVHMMDNASALPTCAQQQQQQKLLLIKID